MKSKVLASIVCMMMVSNAALAVEDKVYAIVNGEEITSKSIAVTLKDPNVKFDTWSKETQKKILNQIIEKKVLAQNAIKTDVVNNPIYKKTLKNLKQELALQVWIEEEIKKIKIEDEDLKSYYKNNKKMFNMPKQFHARHILVKTQNEAESIILTLNKSNDVKSKFISLAKEKSVGPSGKNGGDLGFFASYQMVPEFSNETEKLKVGTFTKNPVKTQFGYHIIYLEDKKSDTTVSFQKAKEQIKQKLEQEELMVKIKKLTDKLKKKFKIEYK